MFISTQKQESVTTSLLTRNRQRLRLAFTLWLACCEPAGSTTCAVSSQQPHFDLIFALAKNKISRCEQDCHW
jgi:hypothetical protein